jgi:hypothetical protein
LLAARREAVAGEAVGREIDDGHDQRAWAECEAAGAELPVESGARGKRHGLGTG